MREGREMAKGTDLWDDSALVDAFDHAIATYKAMHSESYPSKSSVEENQITASNGTDPTQADVLPRETDHEETNIPESLKETCLSCDKNEATNCGLQVKENNQNADLRAKEPDQYSLGCSVTAEQSINCSDQDMNRYNDLLEQYYQIEEQRQKILGELQNAGYWNDQTPVETDNNRPEEVQAYNASERDIHPTCSICSCHPSCAPVVPVSACCPGNFSSGSCHGCPPSCPFSHADYFAGFEHTVQNTLDNVGIKQHNQVEDSTLKLGMMAFERALNAMRNCSDACEEKGKGNGKEETSGKFEHKASQCVEEETDLTDVMRSWYTAGFHTGRHLAEQSKKEA